MRYWRIAYRFVGFFGIALTALAHQLFRSLVLRRNRYQDRGDWAHFWAPFLLKLLNIQPTYVGKIPATGLLCCNHLSYVDILVLFARHPFIFVSKSEVRGWPLIGWLTRLAGTLFINRQRKADVVDLAPQFAPVMQEKMVLVIFPEGTSTGGDRVLPFMSSLLQPAVQNKWPVASAWLGYTVENGCAAEDVCYWRDMTFFPHLINLFSQKSIQAKVIFNPPAPSELDRKKLALHLHDQVESIARREGVLASDGKPPTPGQ
jgi:1-acyl-sn-glycerol-3-phosphate acyltransferase